MVAAGPVVPPVVVVLVAGITAIPAMATRAGAVRAVAMAVAPLARPTWMTKFHSKR